MLDPGTPVGLYVVDGFLGEGSVGMVYRVVDASRVFALKVLAHGGEEARGRFRHEAEIQIGLDHPNIVRGRELISVTDAGRSCPALLMDYVHGLPLDDWLSLNPAATGTQRDRIAGQILDAVAFAHGRGLVHRDLKPANVLIEERADGPHAMITDFGLAKQPAVPGQTHTGLTLGSPRYVAPEQIRDAKRVDHRADIWALGTLLYELYTGRKAFDQPTMLEVMAAVTAGRYVEPTGVPPRVRETLRGALQVDPAARFQDCRAMRAALGVAQAESFLPALGSPILPTTLVSALGTRSVTLVPVEPPPAPAARVAPSRPWLGWALALAMTVALFVAGLVAVAVVVGLGLTLSP
ncbi:MAG: serine/threonine-protein kinase [Myxococcota bacterium]